MYKHVHACTCRYESLQQHFVVNIDTPYTTISSYLHAYIIISEYWRYLQFILILMIYIEIDALIL